jgi:hypothetical protein
VALPPAFTTYAAKYVVISTPNDCMHADAFGIPQSTAQSCTPAQMNAVVDRLIAVRQHALSKGVVPVYDIMPRHEDLDLPRFGSTFGLAWVITEADYRTLRDLGRTRIRAELPSAIQLDIWKDFMHAGDGIHPDDATTRKAAKAIAQELKRRDQATLAVVSRCSMRAAVRHDGRRCLRQTTPTRQPGGRVARPYLFRVGPSHNPPDRTPSGGD